MTDFSSLLPLIPAIFLLLFIPVLVGTLVYRDAAARRMAHPLLWALAAALVPSFLGLLLYLLMRRRGL